MYCKYVWLTLIISDTREAVKRWSNFTASFSKTSCKKAKLLHKIETRYRSHKFVFRRPTLSHAYLKTAFGAILRNNANIWRLHTSTNERVQVIMPYISHLKRKNWNKWSHLRPEMHNSNLGYFNIGQNYFYFRYNVMFDRIACILLRVWARDTLWCLLCRPM